MVGMDGIAQIRALRNCGTNNVVRNTLLKLQPSMVQFDQGPVIIMRTRHGRYVDTRAWIATHQLGWHTRTVAYRPNADSNEHDSNVRECPCECCAAEAMVSISSPVVYLGSQLVKEQKGDRRRGGLPSDIA